MQGTVWGIKDYRGFYDELGVLSWHGPNNPVLIDTRLNPKPSYFGILEGHMEI